MATENAPITHSTPFTDGVLKQFQEKLETQLMDARSDFEVQKAEAASDDQVLALNTRILNAAEDTEAKYEDLTRNMSELLAEHLAETNSNFASLKTRSATSFTSLSAAVDGIKSLASSLQTVSKDACDLRSTASLENSLLNIAATITDETIAVASDANEVAEMGEFALNAAVKTAGIQALIGLSNLEAALEESQGYIGTLNEDIATNLAAAKTEAESALANFKTAKIEAMSQTNKRNLAKLYLGGRGRFPHGLLLIEDRTGSHPGQVDLDRLRRDIDRLKQDATNFKDAGTSTPTPENTPDDTSDDEAPDVAGV